MAGKCRPLHTHNVRKSETTLRRSNRTVPKKRAVFLDRDGVINPLIYHRDAGIVDSPFTLAQFSVLPGVPRAIRFLNDLDLAVVIVSNQPGIAKRHFTASVLRKFDRKLISALKPASARLDAIYYCLHHPESVMKDLRKRCSCRKPGIGMLTRAARDLGLSLSQSYMVGDGLSDIEAGNRAGCRTVFIGRWKCEHCQFIRPKTLRPDLIAKDLVAAVQLIKADLHRSRSGSRLGTDRRKST
jgi:D-glycero-D-manno-heptose 1,7-bisphosphate phosphatase